MIGEKPTTPCREYQGYRSNAGYGTIKLDQKQYRVHRLIIELSSYDQYGTPWDPALLVMHECDNPACVRYDHLRLGTNADNLADMAAKGRGRSQYSNATHCKHGHEFTPENTRIRKDTGHRACIECQTIRNRKRVKR